MKIHGLNIPTALDDAIATGALSRERGVWELNVEQDCYGNHFEADLGEVWKDYDRIQVETEQLPVGFKANEVYGESPDDLTGPGAIGYIMLGPRYLFA